MSQSIILTIHTDGASRGNPGAAAFAYVIAREGQPVIEEAGCLGELTNNQAEYTALVRALEHALRLGEQHQVVLHSDSELMVKQLRGEYKVKDAGLRTFYESACRLKEQFEHPPRFVHVRRALNSRADELCNLALDGRLPSPGALRPSPRATAETRPQPTGEVRTEGEVVLPAETTERAVTCLEAAATAWARGDRTNPPPAAVWEQLLSILDEQGVLRRPAARKRSGRA